MMSILFRVEYDLEEGVIIYSNVAIMGAYIEKIV